MRLKFGLWCTVSPHHQFLKGSFSTVAYHGTSPACRNQRFDIKFGSEATTQNPQKTKFWLEAQGCNYRDCPFFLVFLAMLLSQTTCKICVLMIIMYSFWITGILSETLAETVQKHKTKTFFWILQIFYIVLYNKYVRIFDRKMDTLGVVRNSRNFGKNQFFRS